jgi:4-hydroxy-3-methylbut-2-enyl diphosphate reductase
VYLAYRFYLLLLQKIRKTPAEEILHRRYRSPDYKKVLILIRTWLFPPFRSANTERSLPRVEIDPKAGFCFGVTGAIHHAENELEKETPLYCLGQIVHNDEEVQRLHDLGMVTIDREGLRDIKGSRVLFRAHGEPVESYELASTNGNTVIDASCPIILKLQQRIKESHEQGETILIYGKKNHPEVIGLDSQAQNQAIVFKDLEELNMDRLPEKVSLYSQTTMDIEGFYAVIESLKKSGREVDVHDTICREVSGRGKELEAFARAYEQIVFIAGKNSSNGKVLYEICRRNNPSTLFITFKEELNGELKLNGSSIGITGATSTPRWLMEQVRDRIVEQLVD